MKLLNATSMPAGYTMGMAPDGRELLVVVVKGSFCIPQQGETVTRLPDQQPLLMADTFHGEPGHSAPLREMDFAPHKPRCDVLLTGHGYAPDGQAAGRFPVGLRVGGMRKHFNVTGPRCWQAGVMGVSPGEPAPVLQQSISYDVAFGGVDCHHENPAKHQAFMANPAGKGFHLHLKSGWVDGSAMPNTEAHDQPVTTPDGPYRPMAFGPVGRHWAGRAGLAGTYDQDWLDRHFPFLPPDFDERYYQAAPVDQQIDYPQGGEEVVLVNLTPEGRTRFQLPRIEVPVVFFMRNGERMTHQTVIDTLAFEPDAGLFTVCWRTHLPLKKNMFDVKKILVGRMSRAWWRAENLGKAYYASLSDLDRARRAEAAAG